MASEVVSIQHTECNNIEFSPADIHLQPMVSVKWCPPPFEYHIILMMRDLPADPQKTASAKQIQRESSCAVICRGYCTPTVTTLVTFCSRRWLEIQTEVLTDSNNIVKSVTPPHVITWRQLSADLWPLTSLLSTLTECFRDEIGLWTSLLTCREPPISDGSCCVCVCVSPSFVVLWHCDTYLPPCAFLADSFNL